MLILRKLAAKHKTKQNIQSAYYLTVAFLLHSSHSNISALFLSVIMGIDIALAGTPVAR